jgi:predicted O-methyltransferase YrrM
MNQLAQDLLAKIHPANPYADFPYQDYPLDLQGSREEPLFRQLLSALRPSLVVEVGSWKGDSAIQMARILREQEGDAAVICVDTWLGSLEHLDGSCRGWDIRPYISHGYPWLYHQFLANVMHSHCHDCIVPLPNTSANAARWLERHHIVADLIYVDASHDEDQVYQDLSSFWNVLRPGGILFGDDWHAHWYGVICAVNRFAREKDARVQVTGQKWLLSRSR